MSEGLRYEAPERALIRKLHRHLPLQIRGLRRGTVGFTVLAAVESFDLQI